MDWLALISDCLALFLLWLFVTAGIHKLQYRNRNYYQRVISAYGFDSLAASLNFRRLLGLFELLLGMTILVPLWREVAAITATLLLLGYFVLMATQLWQGKRDVDCGCAGPMSDSKIAPALLVRNAFLIVVALFCVMNDSSALFSAALNDRSAALFALPLAIMMPILYMCCEQLIVNGQKLQNLKTIRS